MLGRQVVFPSAQQTSVSYCRLSDFKCMQHFCSTNLWIWIVIYFYGILLDKSWTTSTSYFDHKQILLPMPYGTLREVENAYLFIYLFTAHTLQIVKPPCVKKEELIKRPRPRVVYRFDFQIGYCNSQCPRMPRKLRW